MYEQLNRERGDRSFSEVIADALDEGVRIEDVAGQRIFDADIPDAVAAETRRLTGSTLDRIGDETT